jgi:hypothetical protein
LMSYPEFCRELPGRPGTLNRTGPTSRRPQTDRAHGALLTPQRRGVHQPVIRRHDVATPAHSIGHGRQHPNLLTPCPRREQPAPFGATAGPTAILRFPSRPEDGSRARAVRRVRKRRRRFIDHAKSRIGSKTAPARRLTSSSTAGSPVRGRSSPEFSAGPALVGPVENLIWPAHL